MSFRKTLLLIVALLGGISPALRGAEPVKRWAILMPAALQKDALGDLLTAEMTQLDGITLVERTAIDQVTDEQTRQAIAADNPSTRLKLGRLLKADVLLILTHEHVDRHERVRMVISDCATGARLGVDAFPYEAAAVDRLASRIAEAAKRTRARFLGGVQFVVGVPPFLSRDVARNHDGLKAAFSDLLQSSLMTTPGVAVIEIDEAQAIRHEAELGGSDALRRIVPLIVEGEYETSPGAKKDELFVSLTVKLSDAKQTLRTLASGNRLLPAAGQWVSGELTTNLLGSSLKNYKPLSPELQFKYLGARADAFALVGDWNEASSMREAALLLQPDSVEQRRSILREDKGLFDDEEALSNLPHALEDAVIRHQKDFADWQAARLARWKRSIAHFEWLVRNHQLKFEEARDLAWHEREPWGLRELTPGAGRPAVRAVLRDFLLNVYPSVLNIDVPAGGKPSAGQRFQWTDLLFLTLTSPDSQVRQQADLDLILEVIDRTVPSDTPVTDPLLRFVCDRRDEGPLRDEIEKFLADLQKRSDKPQLVLIARYAVLYGGACDRWAANEKPTEEMRGKSAELIKQMFAGIPEDPAGDVVRTQILAMNGSIGLGRSISDLGSGPTTRTTPPPPLLLPPPVEEGPISWESILVRLREANGQLVPLTKDRFPFNAFANETVEFKRSGDGPDVLLSPGVVLLHVEDGVVRPVLVDPDAGFEDVAWDGAHLWVSSRNKGLFLLDASGALLGKCGANEGLPPGDLHLFLLPLDPKRICAAGSFGPQQRMWCATVSHGETGFTVHILLKATHRPERTAFPAAQGNVRGDPEEALQLLKLVPGPASPQTGEADSLPNRQAKRSVWLCGFTFNGRALHLVRVDPDSGEASAIDDDGDIMRSFNVNQPPIWLNENEFLSGDQPEGLMRVSVAKSYPDGTRRKMISQSLFKLIAWKGSFLTIGNDLLRIDRKTLQPIRLGPAVKIDPRPMPNDYDYVDSARLGLAVFVHGFTERNFVFYRVSLDPEHRLPLHAVREPVSTTWANEKIEQYNTFTAFNQDGAQLTFNIGLNDGLTVGWNYTSPPNDPSHELEELATRLLQYPEERQRARIAGVQLDSIRSLRMKRSPPALPSGAEARLRKLYAVYQAASDGPAKVSAGQPILDFCKNQAVDLAKCNQQFIDGMRSSLTDRQLRILRYQEPGDPLHFPLPADVPLQRP